MNAGQRLLLLSPLVTGSAAQHLLAIQSGGGVGETIYCSQIDTLIEQQELIFTRKPNGDAVASSGGTTLQDKGQLDIAVLVVPEVLFSYYAADELTVTKTSSSKTVLCDLNKAITARQQTISM